MLHAAAMEPIETVAAARKAGWVIYAHYGDCRQAGVITLERLPGEMPIGEMRARLRCSVCGGRAAGISITAPANGNSHCRGEAS